MRRIALVLSGTPAEARVETKCRMPHAIDATSSSQRHLLDGVELPRHRRDVVPRTTASARWQRNSLVDLRTGEYSILLYLNAQDWSHRDHGGALRAEIGEDKVGVSPRGGRLVIFHSDCIPHAVEEAPERGRVAVVGWLRTRRSDEATSLRDSPRFRAAERLERFGHDGSARRQSVQKSKLHGLRC